MSSVKYNGEEYVMMAEPTDVPRKGSDSKRATYYNGEEWVTRVKLIGGNATEPEEGPPGDTGKSAYEVAVDNGFEGSESEWLDSLKGKDGNDGNDGDNGTNGRGIDNIVREGNTLVFKMTEGEDIEVDLPGDDDDN